VHRGQCRTGGRSRCVVSYSAPRVRLSLTDRRIGLARRIKATPASSFPPQSMLHFHCIREPPVCRGRARDMTLVQLTVLYVVLQFNAAVAGASPGGGLGCPAPRMPKRSVEVMAIDRSNRTVISADPREPPRGTCASVGADGQSAGKFTCLVVGHDWMPNGIWPWRVRGRWLGTAPDWQRCFRLQSLGTLP